MSKVTKWWREVADIGMNGDSLFDSALMALWFVITLMILLFLIAVSPIWAIPYVVCKSKKRRKKNEM